MTESQEEKLERYKELYKRNLRLRWEAVVSEINKRLDKKKLTAKIVSLQYYKENKILYQRVIKKYPQYAKGFKRFWDLRLYTLRIEEKKKALKEFFNQDQ